MNRLVLRGFSVTAINGKAAWLTTAGPSSSGWQVIGVEHVLKVGDLDAIAKCHWATESAKTADEQRFTDLVAPTFEGIDHANRVSPAVSVLVSVATVVQFAECPSSTITAAPTPDGPSGTSVRGLGTKRQRARSTPIRTGAADEELHPLEHVRNWFTDGAPQPRRGQWNKSRRALTRALRECKHRTLTVSQCHSLTLRHVGVKCNLTRSDARNA